MRLRVLAALLVVFAASASAQISKGNLTGIVTDPSGSAVPSATLRLVDTDTGAVRTEQSDASGIYRFMTLDAGAYRVEAEAAGFKKFIREGIELRVDETTTVDVHLEIGQAAESVTVTGESPMLHTESASLGNTVSDQSVAELPIVSRDAITLVQLSPGIQYRATSALQVYSNDGTSQFGSSGTKGMAVFLMDGVMNMRIQSDGQTGGSIGFSPSPDAVQQLDVHTNAFDAEFGHTGGGAVSVTTKSGTNQIHSSVYWYLQNKDLNADPFFNNLAGLPRSEATQNWYGGSVGGPVYVPKVYNGMNKTHFFFDFEGTRVRSVTLANYLVPTPLQLQGNFSQTTNSKLAAVTVYDPSTTVASGSGYVRSPFPGNIIPTSRFDTVANNMLKYYPAANRPITSALFDNFQILQPSGTNWASLVGRIDHQLTSKHSLFVRWGWNKRFDITASTYGSCCLEATNNDEFSRGNLMGAIGDTWLASPRTVVDFRIGFYRYFDAVIPWSTGFDMTTLGFPASFANAVDYKWFPRITMNDGDTINFGDGRSPNVNTQTIGTPLVNVHTNIGRHALKYGFSWQIAQDDAVDPGLTTGGFAASAMGFEFDHTFTQGPNPTASSSVAGNDFASFLLGAVTAGSYPTGAGKTMTTTFTGFYVQDDWKVTDRLSLNLGIRFEHEGPGTERYNRADGGFAAGAISPLQTAAEANYAKNPIPQLASLNVMGGLTFLGVNGEPRGYVNMAPIQYEPRFGYAYRISNRIVWRGGWGLYYIPLNIDYFQNTGFTTVTQMVTSLNGNLTPYNTLSNPFPNGLTPVSGSANGLATSVGQSITAAVGSSNGDPNFLHGLSQQYSMGFQFMLPANVSLETSYAGNNSQHLTLSRNANLYPNQDFSLGTGLNAKVPNPFYGVITDPTSSLSQATTTVAQLLSPYPEFTGLTEDMLPTGRSGYNALQVNIQRRMSHGLYFGAMYVWSKYMEAVTYLNANDIKPSWSISDTDRPQHVALNGVYELPVGKGKAFLNSVPGAVNKVVGGWQVNWLVTFQSGPPLSFGSAIRTTKSSNNPHTITEWFDTTQFTPLPAYTLATLSPYVNDLRAAGINKWDLSAGKSVPITERIRLNLRAEFYNAWNGTQFGSPNTTVTSGSFGHVTSASNSRVVQVAARINF
jgi:hypothetical protein